jgi:hypothetical protein
MLLSVMVDNATKRVNEATERVDVRDCWALLVSRSCLRSWSLRFSRPHQPYPNPQHVTLTLLTTRAASMQIGLNVQLNALINILKFGVNGPMET